MDWRPSRSRPPGFKSTVNQGFIEDSPCLGHLSLTKDNKTFHHLGPTQAISTACANPRQIPCYPEKMADPNQQSTPEVARRRYTWPWFLLAGILLGVLLAVLWMSREIERTRQLRQWNSPPATASTNTAPTRPGP
jgi:hypothetical protein